VAALVAVGILAVDERDVQWEQAADGHWMPLCGYCRGELERLAVVCPRCDRSLDWVVHRAPCTWCLDSHDADHLHDLLLKLDAEVEPLPGALAGFPKAYFLAMDEGSCTYCGGTGAVTDASGSTGNCPVCQGRERCIACGGDRIVVIGDQTAYRKLTERIRARRLAERRAKLTDRPLVSSMLLREDVEALRGYIELEQYPLTRELLERARAKLERAFKALHEETQRRMKAAPRTTGGS
jgi:hypothetical protein